MWKFLISIFAVSSVFADQMIIVDPHFSPYTGGNALLFGEWAVAKTMDAFNPDPYPDQTKKIFLRTLEQVGWLLLDSVACTVQHEVFGHGYRLRELGITPEKYEIELSGGATYFDVPNDFPIGKLQAVNVAGLEAEQIFAWIAKMNWLQKGSIDGRFGMTYFQAEQSLFWYTLITHLGRLKDDVDTPGNDIDSYLFLLNHTYADSHLTLKKLLTWAAFNWLDPMTFYSAFSWFYYIAEKKPFSIPMIRLSDRVRYLPNVKIGFAPYGPEAYLENFFTIDCEPLYFYLKGGKRSVGTGVGYQHLFSSDRGSVGLHFDGWVQNRFISNEATVGKLDTDENTFISNTKIWGGALSFTGSLQLFSWPVKLFAELGGKTAGYLPGYQLGSGVVARVGLIICEN